MKEKFRIGIGTLSLLIGVFLVLDSFSGITGHVVSEQTGKGIGSILGLAFVIGGLLLFALEIQERRKEGGLERNLAQEILKSGKVMLETRKLKRLANRMGYDHREVREGYQVLGYGGGPITVIPNHRRVSIGVYRNIVRALATGESSFRRH